MRHMPLEPAALFRLKIIPLTEGFHLLVELGVFEQLLYFGARLSPRGTLWIFR